MQRIHDPTAVVSLPPPPALSGPIGFFTGGAPGVTPATLARYWWFNMIQEEIMSVLAAGGITPDTTATNFSQLLAAIQTLTGPGRLLGFQIFKTAGVSTYTASAGTNSVVVDFGGGSGAGAGAVANGAGAVSCGGSGALGSFGRARFTTGFNGVSVTVGAGGTPVSGANGGNGGTTSFGALCSAPGGGGGIASGSGTAPTGLGGTPGAAPSGANLFGFAGQAGNLSFGIFGQGLLIPAGGLSSPFGSGGGQTIVGSAGASAVGNLASGAGASQNASSGALLGGPGAAGIVIVAEFT